MVSSASIRATLPLCVFLSYAHMRVDPPGRVTSGSVTVPNVPELHERSYRARKERSSATEMATMAAMATP